MASISRKQALIRAAVAAAGAGWLPALLSKLHAYPLDMPIGCQTYPLRPLIAQDSPRTMKILRDAGFQRVELCSSPGYARAGFGDIANYKGPELREVLENAGSEMHKPISAWRNCEQTISATQRFVRLETTDLTKQWIDHAAVVGRLRGMINHGTLSPEVFPTMHRGWPGCG